MRRGSLHFLAWYFCTFLISASFLFQRGLVFSYGQNDLWTYVYKDIWDILADGDSVYLPSLPMPWFKSGFDFITKIKKKKITTALTLHTEIMSRFYRAVPLNSLCLCYAVALLLFIAILCEPVTMSSWLIAIFTGIFLLMKMLFLELGSGFHHFQ